MQRVRLENIAFPQEFFEDEVREGFFISTMMKRFWAGQIKVLSEIARVCDKHDIRWFADCGTLLGAVRHEGYIPWDDDLDICMLRGDWERFFEVAADELPGEFGVLTLRDRDDYREIAGRIVSGFSIDYSPAHLNEYYGCPYALGVDIFPMDGLYDDEDKEKDRRERAERVSRAYELFEAGKQDTPEFDQLIRVIEKENHVELREKRDPGRELALLAERIYTECSAKEASKVTLMPVYLFHEEHVCQKELFDNWVEIPFENTYVKAPGRYAEVLEYEYGDFMQVRKSGGVHEYPVFAQQEEVIREKIQRNPYRYTLDSNQLLRAVGRYVKKMAEPAAEKSSKKVVFLPCRAKWWNTMEGLWRKEKEKPGSETSVVVLPYYYRNFDTGIGDEHCDKALFPDYVNAKSIDEYDLEKERPDVIVIQVPFDGWNTSMTVPEFFYSDNLLGYTDELVYVPCFDPDDPDEGDEKAVVAVSVLVEQPAVVNADKVILGSETMRDLYLSKLVELAGEPTREYWNKKLVVMEEGEAADDASDKLPGRGAKDKKIMVYYVTISTLLKGGSKAIEKIRRSLDTFSQNADSIEVVLYLQECITRDLERIDETLWQQLKDITDNLGINWKNCKLDTEGACLDYMDKWDGFYGDIGLLPRKCAEKRIPAMIQDVEI